MQRELCDLGNFVLSPEEQSIIAGEAGPILQKALEMQIHTGKFFGAQKLVDVSCAHMMGDIEVMGPSGVDYLEALADSRAQFKVTTTTNARCVDFAAADFLGQPKEMTDYERRIIKALLEIGVVQVDTCINYQTLYQPHFGEHIAWGDTGTVIYANSVLGARSNFESGPAAMSSGLTGKTACYGFHSEENRLGTVFIKVEAKLNDLSDWGVLGCVIGRQCNNYHDVPVITGIDKSPKPDELKHLGASLASHGSLGMFHMVGVTPEAPTEKVAFNGNSPHKTITVTQQDIEGVYKGYKKDKSQVDLVVMSGPQLSIFELKLVNSLLKGRSIHKDTTFIITTNRQNYEASKALGITDSLEHSGVKILVGVCFYLMGAGKIREHFGWSNIMTNSAKVANIIGGYRYCPVLGTTKDCVEAAISGHFAAKDEE